MRWLSKTQLQAMLRSQSIEFFVAEVGCPLYRVDVVHCYEFWKSEAVTHLVAEPDSEFRIEDYPGHYAYIASEWSGRVQNSIVLLEKYH